jgi:tRNA C32,U32 (ribose-2'-O)-methylase TrmJ
MRIPTREEHISMNLGQAVAVCLYELVRDARAQLLAEKPLRATAGEVERLMAVLLDALRASGYVSPGGPVSQEKLRRLILRLNLNSPDAEVWLGMLRQMLWKMRQE